MLKTICTIDTNPFFRFVTQGQSGCEQAHWDELQKVIDEKTVTVVISEVVLLEFDKLIRTIKNEFNNKFDLVKASIKESTGKPAGEKLWNEMGDLQGHVIEKIDEWKEKKFADAEVRRYSVEGFFKSSKIKVLPLDHDLIVRTKKRMISGRFRNKTERAESDCLILESVVRHYEKLRGNFQLLFCSENTKEFGAPSDDGFIFHPSLTEGLPPTSLHLNLRSLVDSIRDNKQTEALKPEEVTEVLERERQDAEEAVMRDVVLKVQEEIRRTPTTHELAYIIKLREALDATKNIPGFNATSLQTYRDAVKVFGSPGSSYLDQLRQAHEAITNFAALSTPSYKSAFEQISPGTTNLISEIKASQEAMKSLGGFSAFKFNELLATRDFLDLQLSEYAAQQKAIQNYLKPSSGFFRPKIDTDDEKQSPSEPETKGDSADSNDPPK